MAGTAVPRRPALGSRHRRHQAGHQPTARATVDVRLDIAWLRSVGHRLGTVDVVHVAALDDDGDVVWLLVDASRAPSLRVERQRLVACDASGTVTVSFEGHEVAGERTTMRMSYVDWQRADVEGLRGNGSLALGVAGRCASLLESDQLLAQVDQARAALDAAGPEDMPAARAAASELCWRAAAQLVVATGGRAVLMDQHAQRLAREALFLMVFGTRPPIKADLLRRLTS